ncbi:BPL-N domain-containing protein [Pseudomonas sp. No.117]
MKRSTRLGYALFAALGLLGSVRLASAESLPSVAVAVYRGPAGCDDCSETVRTALEHLDPRYRVDFIGPQESVDITPATLRRYALYVQPGGGQDIPAALESLGETRVAALRGYVAAGGRYLGLCMGAYLADANNLALIPEELDSEVGRPGFPITTIDDAAVAVRWAGREDNVFYQDGPYLPPSHARGFATLATYANGDIAAARYAFGQGVVALSGPHPEADASWFDQAEIPLEKRPRRPLLRNLVDATLR